MRTSIDSLAAYNLHQGSPAQRLADGLFEAIFYEAFVAEETFEIPPMGVRGDYAYLVRAPVFESGLVNGPALIGENVFTLAAPGLDCEGGTRFGVGYDVVLDCDRDGVLTQGDYLDGGDATAAGFYVVHDTTRPGPLAVSSSQYSGGSWLGQLTDYPTAIGAMGQLPLVVISHGNGHDYTWYDYL